MSSLDSKTLKDFAQAIIGETGVGSNLRYGTVRSDTTGTYVMIDGSSTYTPVLGNVDSRTGDRVTVDFINHQAVITSNISAPSSGYIASEQPIRVYTEYAKNNSQTVPPTSGWSEELPERRPNEYIWSRMVNSFASGATSTDAPKMITGQNGKDGKDGKDALVCGIKQPNCIFNGPSTGVPIGETCYAELYARSGTTTKNISIISSDVTCPIGIIVSSIIGNGSSAPVINFRTTGVITSNREATIRMYVDGVAYTTTMSFGVALNGEDGASGDPGKDSSNMELTSSNGTTFKDFGYSTTITAVIRKGDKEITTLAQAILEYGDSTTNIRWTYKRLKSNFSGIIPDNYPGLSSDKFHLTVSADDPMNGEDTLFEARLYVTPSPTTLRTICVNTLEIDYTEPTSALEIDSSNGTSFRTNSRDTTLSLRLRRGETVIKNYHDAVAAYGSDINIYWYYKHAGATGWTIITGDAILDDGFELEVDSTMVNVSTTFRAEFTRRLSSGSWYTAAISEITIDDIFDGYTPGMTANSYTFSASTPNGADVGDTCETQVYLYYGNESDIITVTASDVVCPSGISATITNSGTTRPKITFTVTSSFTTNRSASITFHKGDLAYTQVFNFSVALKGIDGDTSYSITLVSSDGTVFTDRTDETTITASAKYGNTELSIDNSGNVYNGSIYLGRLKWTQTGKSGYSYLKSKTIPATDVLPYALISVEFNSATGTALYAKNEITLVFCANIKNTARYYQKVSTDDTPPLKPTTYPPPSSWSATEPSISESEVSTKTIYYVEVVQYSDNAFVYSDVSEYTAFVSSKFALSKALGALTTAEAADTNSKQAKQDAYDALIAATAYLKLDPVLQKIVISKLGTSSWKTFAIDSVGCSVGEYNPTNNTFDSYSDFDIHGLHLHPRDTGSVTGGCISMDFDDPNKSDRELLDYCVEISTTDHKYVLKEVSDMTYKIDTIRTMYDVIVSSPGTSLQDRKGSAYLFMAGGEDPNGSLPSAGVVAPGFAIGTSPKTLNWNYATGTGALAPDGSYRLAKDTGIGIIASDDDVLNEPFGGARLIPNPFVAMVGIAENTQNKQWPSFWAFDVASSEDLHRMESQVIDSGHVPLIGFRGLGHINISNNTSGDTIQTYAAYVYSSTSTATVVYVTVPLAYPVPVQAVITFSFTPTNFMVKSNTTLRINSISGKVTRDASKIVFILTCDYNSSLKTYDTFTGRFGGNFEFNIT